MEGVIVQTERIYREMPIAIAVALIVGMAVFLTWYLLNVIRFCKKNKDKAVTAVARYVAVTLLCIIFSGLSIGMATTIHSDLIVTIDDHVSFNEFNKHYEVIDKDGNLYTVRELPIEDVEAGDNE